MKTNTYLSNAFSLQMLNLDANTTVSVTPIAPHDVPADAVSCIGHPDTAHVVSNILGREVPMNRANVHLELGDVLYVAQITGGRLPEGATTLPEGFSLKFLKVEVVGR